MENIVVLLEKTKIFIEPLISIGVLSAIILFVVKEIIDYSKIKQSEKNKKNAISFLICEEIKLNHWALKKLFGAYRDLSHLFEDFPCAVYRVRKTRFGIYHFEIKETPEKQIWSGYTLPTFQTKRFYELLPSLAELDIDLAKNVKNAYEEIADLEHFRQTIILFVNNEDMEDEIFRDMTKVFISEFAKEEKDYFSAIEQGYKKLTGKNLKEFKLR